MIRALASGFLLVVSAAAWAHSWYPQKCCSDRDCYQITAEDVQLTPGGWRIVASGQIMNEDQVHYSPDGRYHRCSSPRNGYTYCLFIPPPMM